MKLEKFNEFYEPKQYQDYELENGICVMQLAENRWELLSALQNETLSCCVRYWRMIPAPLSDLGIFPIQHAFIQGVNKHGSIFF